MDIVPEGLIPKDLTPAKQQFLEGSYFTKEYIVPDTINDKLKQIAGELQQQFPEFRILTVVGGIANGSYSLRALEKEQTTPGVV